MTIRHHLLLLLAATFVPLVALGVATRAEAAAQAETVAAPPSASARGTPSQLPVTAAAPPALVVTINHDFARQVNKATAWMGLRPPWALPQDARPRLSGWLRADPRRWPRLFANTTECTLSLNPITRRHQWEG